MISIQQSLVKLFVLTALICTPFNVTHSQQKKSPETKTVSDGKLIATKVQKFYDQTKTVKARFAQTYFHKLYNRHERSNGSVIFQKPGKMRWNYDQPNGKIMIAKKDKLIFFEPADSPTEPGQLIEQTIGDNQLPLAFSFLLGTGKLTRDFKIARLDETKLNYSNGYVIELTPNAPSPYYEKLLFFVGSGKIEGVVRRIIIVDAAGNRNQFDFSKFGFDKKIPKSTFDFEAPKGTRTIRPPKTDS